MSNQSKPILRLNRAAQTDEACHAPDAEALRAASQGLVQGNESHKSAATDVAESGKAA